MRWFLKLIDIYFQCQINLEVNLPHFEIVHETTHKLFKLGFPCVVQKCILRRWKSLQMLRLIALDL